jgi:IS5 family transposase
MDTYIENEFIPKEDPLIKMKNFLDLDFLPLLLKESYNNNHYAGRDPIDPRILFMILLLEFLRGFSDMEVVKQLKMVPLYRSFVGLSVEDKIPDDTTISYFRTKRLGEEKAKAALDQVVKQLFDAGLIDGKIQTQDATDMRGDVALLTVFQLISKCRKNLLSAVENVSPNKARKLREKFAFEILRKPKDKQKHFEELLENIRQLVGQIKNSTKLLKDKVVQKELAFMERVLKERDDEFFDDEGKKQIKENAQKITGKMINPSDPDVSWGAKTKDKFFAGYKTMINEDHKYGLVTEAETEKAGHPEEKSAVQLLQQQKDNLGIVPEHFTADAKYDAGNTRAEIKAVGAPEQNINLYIPLIPTKNKAGGFLPDQFFFEDGHLFCPAGYPAAYSHPDELKLGIEYKFEPSVCAKCALRSECTTAKSGRRVFVSHTQMEREATKSFNTSDQFEIMYKEQHWKVEPKNSDLKNNQGLKRARYRGLPRVRIQVYLAVIANNLKKYCKIIAGKIKEGITNTLAKVIALGPPG